MREIEVLRRQLAEAQAEARVARRERANLEARLTAQKQTEAALRDSEERLHMALEAGRMGAWRLDLKTGVQQWSPTQYGLFGLNPNTTSPSRDLFLSLVLPEDRPIVEYAPEDLLPGRGFLDSEFRIRRPDGEVRWLVARTTVRRDKHGEPLEMVGLNWDITDRKLTEEELRKGEERLQFLVEELQHRTRNLMGVVMAMSDMTAHASSTLDDFRTSFGERLRALARVQGLSSRSQPAAGSPSTNFSIQSSPLTRGALRTAKGSPWKGRGMSLFRWFRCSRSRWPCTN